MNRLNEKEKQRREKGTPRNISQWLHYWCAENLAQSLRKITFQSQRRGASPWRTEDVLVGNAVWSNSQVSRSETIVGLLARQFAWNWISLYFSLFLPLPVSYSSTRNAIYPARSIQYRSVCLPPPVSTASRNSGLADFLVPRLEELSSGIVMAHAS